MQYFALFFCYDNIFLIARKLCKTRQGRTLDSRFFPANPTTATHPLGYANLMVNLTFGDIDNIAVHFEPIMTF